MLRSSDHRNHSEARPSECITRATVTLLGLSYGEHDGGLQRSNESKAVSEILQQWGCGLLLADYGRDEEAAVASAFEKFVLSPPAPDLFEWASLSSATLLQLVDIHCQLAFRYLTDLSVIDGPPPAERLPPRNAARSLSVVRLLLDREAKWTGDTSSTISANTVAHFFFCAARLRASVSEFPSLSEECIESLPVIFDHFFRLCQQPTEQHLLAYVLPKAVSVALVSICADANSSSPQDVLPSLLLSPALTVLASLLTIVTDDHRLRLVLPTVLEGLMQTVDHVHVGTRLATLDILEYIKSRVPDALLPYASQLSDRLPAAMLWKDPPSTMRTIPLLDSILPALLPSDSPPPLVQEPPRTWHNASIAILSTVSHHVDASLIGKPDHHSGSDIAADHAMVASQLASVVVHTFRHRLLLYTSSFLTQMCKLFPRVASLAASSRVDRCHLTLVAAAIQSSLRYVWPRAHAHSARLIAACVEAVLETRCAKEPIRNSAQSAALAVVSGIGEVDASTIMLLVQNSERFARKYESLSQTVEFFREAEVILGGYVSNSTPVNQKLGSGTRFGPIVEEFF